ncbi:hypothetical protein [Acetobacter senegalensis]|uniref:hypothetical protein n=1 Tax=Acetobacter senegalensis TaxID=446692 RepID=UPI00264D1C86|nr:hypothetical protein [Acetobacter senegalensis]MDN7353043.1 hypothetical protein [Acetobacter senegalensis]
MAIRLHSLLLGAALIAAPAFALAQDDSSKPPTADSAASQVGKPPPAAVDKNGKRIDPSKKLWTNPRTEAEQPGTQPPPNDKPAGTTESNRQSVTSPHAYQPGKYQNGKYSRQRPTPPHTETQPQN